MRIAYYALHYGKEYLAWSIRSIQDAVDEVHVLYTDRPSYGHGTSMICPDSEAELRREAERFLTKPLIWHRGNWNSEPEHRDTIRDIARGRGAHLALVVDADEVWDSASARMFLDSVDAHNAAGSVCARFVHFWRSFRHVCIDPCMPVRCLDLRHPWQSTWYSAAQPVPVLHFGYAQSEAIMRYKWSCHGHQAEMRPNWMNEKFIGWSSGVIDVHPCNHANFWSPVETPVEIASHLDILLGDHPYRGHVVVR